MGLLEILNVVAGILKFWNSVVWFVQLLQKTPQEQHAALVKASELEAARLKETGRPIWD